MTRARITERDISSALLDVSRLMVEDLHMVSPVLYQGSHENGVHNVLRHNGRDLFAGYGGTTRRDCYNALQTQAGMLRAVVEHQRRVRAARAMSGL